MGGVPNISYGKILEIKMKVLLNHVKRNSLFLNVRPTKSVGGTPLMWCVPTGFSESVNSILRGFGKEGSRNTDWSRIRRPKSGINLFYYRVRHRTD